MLAGKHLVALLAMAFIISQGYVRIASAQSDFQNDIQHIKTQAVPKTPATLPPPVPQKQQNKTTSGEYGLGFSKVGIVTNVYVKAGQTVHRGDLLVTLDTSEIVAKVHQAEATLELQQAKLDALTATSSADTTSADAQKLISAQAALEDAKRSAVSVIMDGYVKADDAVRNRADQFFSYVKSPVPQIILSNIDGSTQNALTTQRVAVENLLNSWKGQLDVFSASVDIVSLDTHLNNLLKIKNFLDSVAGIVNGVASDPAISQFNLHSWKGDLYTGRLNVNGAVKDTLAARAKLRDTQAQVDALGTAMPMRKPKDNTSQILQQQIQIKQAQATLELLKAQLRMMTLLAPQNGQIRRIVTTPGAVTTANTPILFFKPSKVGNAVTSTLGAGP